MKNLHNFKEYKPKKIIFVDGMGLVLNFRNVYNKTENYLLVIHNNGLVGKIVTKEQVYCFSIKNGKIWYSNKNNIYCIDSSGIERQIINYNYWKTKFNYISNEIIDIQINNKNECIFMDFYGDLRCLSNDGTLKFIHLNYSSNEEYFLDLKSNNYYPSKNKITIPINFKILPDNKSYLVSCVYDIVKIVEGIGVTQTFSLNSKTHLYYSDLNYDNNIIYFLLGKNQCFERIDNINYIRCFDINSGEQKKSLVNCVEFANLQIGKKINNYVFNNKGELIISTEKGLYNTGNIFRIRRGKKFNLKNSYLWNPKLIKIEKYTKKSKKYANILMLSLNRLSDLEEIENIPNEIYHIILSHTETWQFPSIKFKLL